MTRDRSPGRLRRFALVALVPTVIDIALLVALRQGAGWILVVADVVAIAVASAFSYVLHRTYTLRSDPFVRWVRMPLAFIAVATVAGLVDVVVLRSVYAATGFDTTPALVAAKLVALSVAAVVRLALYRALLLQAVRQRLHEQVPRPPAPGSVRATVVIPALDEAAGIARTISAVRSALAGVDADGGVEIVVADDGSADGTADAALAAGADQVVVLPENRGKGAAVRAGVAAARGRSIAFTDADLAYSPDQLLGVLRKVEGGWDAVIGSRRHPGTTRVQGAGVLRDLGSRSVNLLAMAVLLSHPHDTQCGLKAFRSDTAKQVFGLGRVDRFAFDIEVLHLLERHGWTVVEVPVTLSMGERTTVRLARDTLRLVRDLWRIRRWSATGAYELSDPAPVPPVAQPTS
ncbi:MAG: glycosyltransferase [Acidimicrobiales bacterium]